MARPLRIEFPGAIYHVTNRMLGSWQQSLSTACTVYFNKRHRRHGHLLDGRFKAKLVSGDDFLLQLSRYVHQNRVWTGG